MIVAAETASWDMETFGLEKKKKITGKNISGDIDLLFDLYLFYGCVELRAPEEGGLPLRFSVPTACNNYNVKAAAASNHLWAQQMTAYCPQTTSCFVCSVWLKYEIDLGFFSS